MELKFTVQTKIQKPVAEVFDAVHNPSKIAQYFATAGASAPLDPGTTVIWQFADFPGEVPVRVKEVVTNQLIAFEWDAGEGADDSDGKRAISYDVVCRVELKFESLDD